MTSPSQAPAVLGQSYTYVFQPAFLVTEETERLDEMHRAITGFFGGNLFPSVLPALEVKRILELGAGSGAWAIQAALDFPDAEIVAVDINPLPNRHLPDNVVYQKIDLTKPFPFEAETFDIIHARFVMMHVPHGEDVLRRTIHLVKPGGWLLIEEPDDESMADGEDSPGPEMSVFLDAWKVLMHSRNADPGFGRHIEDILRSSSCFDQINIKKIKIPLSEQSKDRSENDLGRVWKKTMHKVGKSLPLRFREYGITDPVVEGHLKELNDKNRSITTDMYFCWSKKRVKPSA